MKDIAVEASLYQLSLFGCSVVSNTRSFGGVVSILTSVYLVSSIFGLIAVSNE